MRRKLSTQFLTNYLIAFLLSLAATALAFALLSVASGRISATLAKNKYPASSILREDYTEIDASPVVQNGGGVQVVDREYRVVYSSGLDTIGKTQLSAGELTEFLLQSKDRPYHYDVAYAPEGGFWLIVTFPTSIRLDFSMFYNKDAAPGDFARAGGVLAAVAAVYLLLLAALTLVFSRITAAGIVRPLRKLSDGTRLLREGDYSVRVDLRLKNEFAELQDTFNAMAERIEREMALRKKSEQDRRRLILDISHDLKNPLSSILGYAELCQRSPELPQREREYLRVIEDNGRRANLLLNDLFELSQMDSPEFSIEPVRTDLCEYLRQALGDLLPLFDSAGFQYAFDIPEDGVCALIDPARFGRILQNLADNAVRHNPQGTAVCVRLSVEGGMAVIEFSDDGVGIPAHLWEDIFKPFVRAYDSRSAKGGSGLGLSIAKRIAEAHGGSLAFRAGEPRGSVFIIALPTI